MNHFDIYSVYIQHYFEHNQHKNVFAKDNVLIYQGDNSIEHTKLKY